MDAYVRVLDVPSVRGGDGGNLVQVRTGARNYSAYCKNVIAPFVSSDAPAPEMPKLRYVLVASSDGGRAFVPEEDDALCQAFLSASGEPDDRTTETLAAEIQRRGLKV